MQTNDHKFQEHVKQRTSKHYILRKVIAIRYLKKKKKKDIPLGQWHQKEPPKQSLLENWGKNPRDANQACSATMQTNAIT